MRDGDKRIVRLKEGSPAGRHVVIVDDLVQSGGTLIECQSVLAELGAAHGMEGGEGRNGEGVGGDDTQAGREGLLGARVAGIKGGAILGLAFTALTCLPPCAVESNSDPSPLPSSLIPTAANAHFTHNVSPPSSYPSTLLPPSSPPTPPL